MRTVLNINQGWMFYQKFVTSRLVHSGWCTKDWEVLVGVGLVCTDRKGRTNLGNGNITGDNPVPVPGGYAPEGAAAAVRSYRSNGQRLVEVRYTEPVTQVPQVTQELGP